MANIKINLSVEKYSTCVFYFNLSINVLANIW